MKKIIFTFIVLAFLANVSAQLKVNSLGDTYVYGNIYMGSTSNLFSTTNNIPITFNVNNVLAGFTGNSTNSNVSFGYGALHSNTTGYSNTANGSHALYGNTKGEQSTANGSHALYGNSTGRYNTASGSYALCNNSTGSENTANAFMALYSNTTGSYNVANGYRALHFNTTGYNNTANGYMALYNNTTGYSNAVNGYYTLGNNTTGSYNTAVGFWANVNANNLTNATAIGYNANATASNQVVIGNNNVISIVGPNSFTIYSDGRTKKNIRAEVPGLTFINLLQPVMYNLDLDALDELQKSDDQKINQFRDSLCNARSPEEKAIEAKARADKEKIVYSGFIAQDVENAAQSVGYDFSGVDAPGNGKGAYGLRYAEFVVPLVKAVQELSEQNALLQEQINELKRNSSLRSATNDTETTGIVDPIITQCKLYQNTPNPFNQNTEIKYYVPENIKIAQLCIYNLQGAQIKQISITQQGESSQWISGSELRAGMYLYALIVDGKEVDTKRMILTK